MNDNAVDLGKPPIGNEAEEMLIQSHVSSENLMFFQVFFLTRDDSQSVEVIETEKIDFEEINQRLKTGENVFIKRKNSEIFGSIPQTEGKNEKKTNSFTRC